jgi:hypothetical protein
MRRWRTRKTTRSHGSRKPTTATSPWITRATRGSRPTRSTTGRSLAGHTHTTASIAWRVVHEQRRLPDCDLTEVDGIPIVTPELLVLQLAWWKPHPNYVEAVVHALRRKRLISYASTHATFVRHARRGFRGIKATRIALERWNPANAASASEMETLLFQMFRAHDLPEPVLQFEVRDHNGLFVAYADVGLPQWRITVEYESMQEHLDEFQIARDTRRRNRVIAAGYWPLVARVHDLRSGGHELADEIRAVARRQGAQLA